MILLMSMLPPINCTLRILLNYKKKKCCWHKLLLTCLNAGLLYCWWFAISLWNSPKVLYSFQNRCPRTSYKWLSLESHFCLMWDLLMPFSPSSLYLVSPPVPFPLMNSYMFYNTHPSYLLHLNCKLSYIPWQWTDLPYFKFTHACPLSYIFWYCNWSGRNNDILKRYLCHWLPH